jgi:hypothetical protein
MTLLSKFSPDQEVYSVDESFLDLTSFKSKDLILLATFTRLVSESFNMWNDKIEKETNYKNITKK